MNFNKKLAVAVSGAVLLMAGQVALADSTTDIVDALVMKGVLTEEEGKLINKGHTSKTKVAPVVKEKDGAFILESANERNSIQLTGRMHLDYRASNLDAENLGGGRSDDRDTASMADQFELRRARLGVKGKFAKDFKYEVVGNLPGTATIDIAYMDFAKYDAFQIRAGKFKQPFGLEELISSNNITMMERSYLDQTVPGKKIGVQVMGSPAKGLTYAGSIFQNNDVERDMNGDGYASGAGRATFNFAESMGDKERVMHLGLSGLDSTYAISTTNSSQSDLSISSTQRGTISAFRSAGRGLANIFRGQIQGSGVGSDSRGYAVTGEYGAKVNQKGLGLEGIYASGPFKVMAEYSRGQYKATHNVGSEVKYDTDTYYVETGYFLTGEKYSDSYKNGVFGGFKPKNEFDLDKGDLGAIELALRIEGYAVDSGSISSNTTTCASGTSQGGRFQGNLSGYQSTASSNGSTSSENCNAAKSSATTYTAGIRWILNPNIVVKANLAHTKLGYNYTPIDIGSANAASVNSETLFMTRLQYMF
jgi:phosphate-selective porin OprO/OprP